MNSCALNIFLIWTSIINSIGQSGGATVNSHTTSEMNAFLAKCGDFNFDLLPGYPVFNNISNQDVLNVAHGKFEAYIQFVQKRVMQRDDWYFSIKQFPVAYQFVFPPYFPIVCYQVIMKSMRKEAHSTLHRVLIGDIWRMLPGVSDFSYVDRYMVYKVQLYRAFNDLKEYLQEDSPTNSSSFVETCRELVTKEFFEYNGHDFMLYPEKHCKKGFPKYDRVFLNNLAKILIADVVVHQIVMHGCMGFGHTLNTDQRDMWSRAKADLERREDILLRAWLDPPDLEKDISNFTLLPGKDLRNSWEDIRKYLGKTYYWLFFRINVYTGPVAPLCFAGPGIKCVTISDVVYQVRWRPRGGEVEDYSPNNHMQHDYNPVFRRREENPNPEGGSHQTPGPVSSKTQLLKAALEGSLTKILDDIQNPLLQQFKGSQPTPVPEVFLAVKTAFEAATQVLGETQKNLHPLSQAACSFLSTATKRDAGNVFQVIKDKFDLLHDKFESTHRTMHSVLSYFDNMAKFPDGSRPVKTVNWGDHASYTTIGGRLQQFRTQVKFYRNRTDDPVNTAHVENMKNYCSTTYDRFSPLGLIKIMHGHLVEYHERAPRLGDTIHTFYGVQYHRMHALLAIILNELAELLASHAECTFYTCLHGFDNTLKNDFYDAMEYAQDLKWEIFNIDNEHRYKWLDEFKRVLAAESPSSKNDAERLAKRFETLYPWNDFFVLAFKAHYKHTHLPLIGSLCGVGESPNHPETIFQFKQYSNPDYSAVHVRQGRGGRHDTVAEDDRTSDTYTIVNWGMRGEAHTPLRERIDYDCANIHPFSENLRFHINRRVAKSLFAWRTFDGIGCQPHDSGVEDMDDNSKNRPRIWFDDLGRPGDQIFRSLVLRGRGYTHPNTCCDGRAGKLAVRFESTHCWINVCGFGLTCGIEREGHHRFHHTNTAWLANNANGY